MTTQPPSDQPESTQPPPAPETAGPVKAATLTPETVKPKKSPFGRETKAGRALRRAIQVLAFAVGFFGLGFFTAYLLLYRPLANQAKANNVELVQLRQDIEAREAELERSSLTFQGVEEQNKQYGADLEKANARAAVLQVLNKITEARLNLAEDDASAARLGLDEAEKLLSGSLPQLEKLGAASADTFAQLFELARSDLARNAGLAAQDLERLTSELLLVNETLAK